MNLQTSLETLWRARLDAMLRAWPRMRRGNLKALHQARVASRRIREALPVVAAGVDRTTLKKLNRKVRDITRLLGPVRALDVSLGVLASLKRSTPPQRAAVALVRQHLVACRRTMGKRMMDRADRIDLKKLVRKLARLDTGRDQPAGRRRQSAASWQSVLAARTVRRATRLREAIEEAGGLYVPERLHAVRIATKRLRYVLEVGEESEFLCASGLVQPLRGVQETLGRLHDLQSVLAHVRDLHASIATQPAPADLDRLIQSLEHKCRRLHAEFMVRRDDLLKLCTRARREAAGHVVGRPSAARAVLTGSRRDAAATAGQVSGASAETRATAAMRSVVRHG